MSRGRNDVPEFLVGNILNLTTIMRVIADTSCDWLFSARTTQWISTITVDIASFFSHVAASFSSAFIYSFFCVYLERMVACNFQDRGR
jgi:hypothetical protein